MAVDLITGGQDAIVELLRAALPADRREMVRHSLKENTKPPFHLIGDIDSENVGSKGDQIEKLTADVHTVYRGGDRRELLALMHEVRVAGDEQTVTIPGAQFRFRYLGAIAGTAASDGVTYAGVTTFEIDAYPA